MSNIFNVKMPRLINNINNINLCDRECLRKKKLNDLQQNYYRAKSSLQSAPNEYEKTRKDYFTFKYGLNGYNKILEKEYKKEVSIEKGKLEVKFNEQYNKISTNIKQLEELQSYSRVKMPNTYAKYFLEGFDNITFEQSNDLLQQEEELITRNLTNQITLNSRKSYYELEGYTSLHYYYHYYYIFYYIFFIILCILFIKKNNISYYTKFFIVFILAFYPYYISYVVNNSVNFLQKVYNKLPIHIYSNL